MVRATKETILQTGRSGKDLTAGQLNQEGTNPRFPLQQSDSQTEPKCKSLLDVREMFSYCYNIKCKDFAFTWMDETNNENYFSSVQSSENNALMHRPIENFTGEARNKYSGGGLEDPSGSNGGSMGRSSCTSDLGTKASTIPKSRKRKAARKAPSLPKRQKLVAEKTLPIHVSDDDEVSDGFTGSAVSEYEYEEVAISNTDRIDKYYKDQVEKMDQMSLKTILRAWVKEIHPQKQTSNPYKDGQKSAPIWWPKDCPHKGPDHLIKEERLLLFVHVLRKRSVAELRRSTVALGPTLKNPCGEMVSNFLEGVYEMREREENWKDDGRDVDSKVFIELSKPDSPKSRNGRKSRKSRTRAAKNLTKPRHLEDAATGDASPSCETTQSSAASHGLLSNPREEPSIFLPAQLDGMELNGNEDMTHATHITADDPAPFFFAAPAKGTMLKQPQSSYAVEQRESRGSSLCCLPLRNSSEFVAQSSNFGSTVAPPTESLWKSEGVPVSGQGRSWSPSVQCLAYTPNWSLHPYNYSSTAGSDPGFRQ